MHRLTEKRLAVAVLVAVCIFAAGGALGSDRGGPNRDRGRSHRGDKSEASPASFEESLPIDETKLGDGTANRDGSPALPPPSAMRRAKAAQGERPTVRAVDAGSSLATGLASLAVVLGLFFIATWALRRGMPAGANLLPYGVVEILGRAPLAGRQQVYLVRVGNKLLLVALGQGTVEALTEITDLSEVESLTERCRRPRTVPASASFARLLQQLGRDNARSQSSGDRRQFASGTIGRETAAAQEGADG